MLNERDMIIYNFIQEYGALTINQCAKIFFLNYSQKREMARRSLNRLKNLNLIRSSTLPNFFTKEHFYYVSNLPTTHKIFFIEYLANLIYNGCKIIEYSKNFLLQKNDVTKRPDGFFCYEYEGYRIYDALEIVIFNKVDFKKYERLKEYGFTYQSIFPRIIIIGNQIYKGKNLNVITLDLKMSNFKNKILNF